MDERSFWGQTTTHERAWVRRDQTEKAHRYLKSLVGGADIEPLTDRETHVLRALTQRRLAGRNAHVRALELVLTHPDLSTEGLRRLSRRGVGVSAKAAGLSVTHPNATLVTQGLSVVGISEWWAASGSLLGAQGWLFELGVGVTPDALEVYQRVLVRVSALGEAPLDTFKVLALEMAEYLRGAARVRAYSRALRVASKL